MPLRPLRPLTLNFNAPVPREQALAARLLPEAIGAPIAPTLPDDERGVTPQSVRFAAPLAENTRFRLTLPPGLRDGAGRALANAGSFPLAVATGGLPPLAKFAGVPFGVPEPARTSATTGASASPTATRSACVTSPRDGSVFVLDPDIPMASRRLGFEGAPGRWTLDGRVLGDGERLRWLPQPGRHVLQRQGADAGDAVRVAFEVRAAPPPAARPTGSDR